MWKLGIWGVGKLRSLNVGSRDVAELVTGKVGAETTPGVVNYYPATWKNALFVKKKDACLRPPGSSWIPPSKTFFKKNRFLDSRGL